MRSAVLSLAVVLTCSFFSTNAQASRDEYYEHGGRGYYGGGYYEESKFYGTVEAMPQGGFLGTWRISGRDVLVTQQTYIKQKYGPLGLGVQVEVKGGGSPFSAYELESKGGGVMTAPPPPSASSMPVPSSPPPMGLIKFYGPVEAMPQGGFLGAWRIGGRDVLVTQQTYIKQQYGPLAPGAQVEVKGGGSPFTAYELEVKGSVMR